MSFTYHVVSAGRYFRIEGTAASPVLSVGPVDLTSPYSAFTPYCIFSPDGGQTLWAGGTRPTGGFLKSVDGGLNWVDQYDHMPAANGDEQVTSIAYDPDSGVMCATYQEHSGFSGVAGGILKYDPGTEDWVKKAGDASWANAGTTNMCVVNGVWYCGVQFGATRRGLYRSTDDGETWVVDSSWTYTNWQGNGPPQLAVDSGNNFCCVNAWLAAANWRAYERYGQFGTGPFTPTAIIPPDDWGYAPPNGQQSGRLMMVDEQDAFWLAIDRNSLTHIVRRDPTSGLWSIEHVFTASSGARAIAVADSQNIWAANQGGFAHVSLYDGTTWHDHSYTSIHASLQSTAAVWGMSTEAPFLRNQSPAPNDTSIPLSTNISYEIADNDSAIDGYSIVLTINGQTAYQYESQQSGFTVSRWSLSDGYRFLIDPDCDFDSGTITIDAYAIDMDSNVLDTSYWFKVDIINIFDDDFNDGVASIEFTPRNGNITESGGRVNLSIPDFTNGDYWTTINNAPFAHVGANWDKEDTAELIYTAELVSWSYVDANAVGGFNLFYGANPSQWAYYFEYAPSSGYLGLRYFENYGTNTFGSSTTIADPSVTPIRLRIRHDFPNDLLTFEYSTDSCTWTQLGTRTPAFTPDRIGFYVKNWSSIRATSASWNFLTIGETTTVYEEAENIGDGGFTDVIEFPDGVGPNLDPKHTFPQNSTEYNANKDLQKTSGLTDSIEWPDTAGGNVKHTTPRQPSGHFERPLPTGLHDDVQYWLGSSELKAESQSTDSEGHPHFVGRRAYVSYFYDGYSDPWNDPTNTNHTGYARDGYKYTNGVLDGGPVYAPWASESSGTDRSSRRDFPVKALIVGTLSEVTIFDMDGYESTGEADVWMRFRYGSGSNYYQIGASDGRYVNDILFKDGVLAAVSGQTTIGGLKIVDFRAESSDFFALVRSDYDYDWGTTGTDITDRNATGIVRRDAAPNPRIASEYPESVSAVFLPRSTPGDYDEWYAVGGEDNISLVKRTNISGTKAITDGLYEARGETSGSTRRVMFDKNGILWYSVDNRIHRDVYNYQELQLLIADRNTGGQPQMVATLPSDITCLADGPGYIFVGTTIGVYIVQKSDMSYHLAYTISGGGGGGKQNVPPDGELLVGGNPDIQGVRAFSSDSVIGDIGFVSVATSYTTDKSGGVTLIRLYDETVITSQEFPALAEDGAYFPELIIY
jgi:hypothetical protein